MTASGRKCECAIEPASGQWQSSLVFWSIFGAYGGAALELAESAPGIAIFPGPAISLAVFGFNLFGDSLRDALDPRLGT